MKEERTKRPGGERALLLAAAVFFLILCAACLPLIRWMFQPEFGPWLQGKVEAMGMWGVLALLGVQILQPFLGQKDFLWGELLGLNQLLGVRELIGLRRRPHKMLEYVRQ